MIFYRWKTDVKNITALNVGVTNNRLVQENGFQFNQLSDMMDSIFSKRMENQKNKKKYKKNKNGAKIHRIK